MTTHIDLIRVLRDQGLTTCSEQERKKVFADAVKVYLDSYPLVFTFQLNAALEELIKLTTLKLDFDLTNIGSYCDPNPYLKNPEGFFRTTLKKASIEIGARKYPDFELEFKYGLVGNTESETRLKNITHGTQSIWNEAMYYKDYQRMCDVVGSFFQETRMVRVNVDLSKLVQSQ